MDCVLCEFWICGVVINFVFLENIIDYVDFWVNNYIMCFIDDMLVLFEQIKWQDWVIKFLIYIVDVVVNGYLEIKICVWLLVDVLVLVVLDFGDDKLVGMKQLLDQLGLKGFVGWMKD